MDWKQKNVLVIGAGVSGFAAAKLARRFGAAVTLSDAKTEDELEKLGDDFSKLRELGVALAFGPQQESLLESVDTVIVSPAVPVRIPLIQAAYEKGIRVMSEVELAYDIIAESPICAVTGTNGKTTTTTLLGLLLETHYDKVGVGGNIGVPLSEEALRIGKGGCIAAEISSYQMEATEHFHPHISSLLNVTPDHIVRHGSMEVYQAMKERIFREETPDDYVVLNYDDEKTRGMKARTQAQVCYFSRREELEEGVFVRGSVRDGLLVIRWQGEEHALCRTDELGIKGPHNVENALAAIAVAFFAGCEPALMVPVLKSFRGVEHRIEYVTTIDGVPYYNDSKATNTDSAIKALETFDGHIVLLAGGDDKMTDLTDFMKLVCERVDALVLIGRAAARFYGAAVENGFPEERIYAAGYSMRKAVKIAHALAKEPGVVLLSPACASFDMYHNMAERGRDFKHLVHELEQQK
ncbi:UDP-N-acetylmuramoyl-L-alanine--D-glutamate ligase [Mitsuokella jalaludinii]|uniref:UDP-N-acetylmuramoyl-L-alanine--D-glutamate ligase n=1 Tax=Mitsuokella jalaludinii TaxID=187979 RepID=UPI0006DC7894|nr:UDP-N-acetylmuramoyl-L-alanine--D-glutamate ligase [Mitsuokella jalaludinii]